ncbi:CHAT domain-containing protein [Amycolatopsis alba]|uniref:CHAT domain-containing protein n=1 Tax=Amycolatopsis alba DSM 44262 TaxID=1125972 RepID=A0A229S2F1_AMYAL|nr:CHAT domain-containing protein [Amycolatopsis alba]OXM53103.1 CHAT domain-containing protein [Amycolatopsis alba DSM 44262]
MAAPHLTDRVQTLHVAGVEATNNGDPLAGRRMLLTALRLLGWPQAAVGEPAQVVRVLNSLAGVEVVLGNTEHGFELLDAADAMVEQDGRGLLLQQRGLLLVLVGRLPEALYCLDDAIPLLSAAGEEVVLARALLNRALLHQVAGRVRPAMADLDRCTEIARHHESERGLVAKALHGRGQCKVLTGDIPGALRDFDAAGRAYERVSDGMLAPLAVDKARALLAVGLPSDAAVELDSALTRFAASRMDQEHAEAELTRACAALAAGEHEEARKWAMRAKRHFHRRRNETWAAIATLTVLRADLETGRGLAAVAATGAALDKRLRVLGLYNDADVALLLSASAHISLHDHGTATSQLTRGERPGAPLMTRLLRRLVQAELGAAQGNRRKAFAQAQAGLALLRGHRGQFGSLDLRTGMTSLGGELAGIGLAAAMETGNARVILRWVDRSRAQAFRVRPAHARADDGTLDAVAELRHLTHQARIAELAGRGDPVTLRRCAELEREIKAKDWQTDGTGEFHHEATYDEVLSELSDADSVMVSFLVDRGEIRGLVTGGGSHSLLRLGDLATVSEALARLRGDLNASCGRVLPSALDQVIRASIQRQLAVLEQQLVRPLLPMLGDLDVVLVPTGILTSVPWGLFPLLRGRPVTVTPSPSAWLAARQAWSREPARDGRALVVAGPALDHAKEEAERLASIYPDGIVLHGRDATVEATLKAIDQSTIAHFAAHGHHEQENVLFSRLDLADGPLIAYDVHRLESVPEHVVLSACDVGQAVVRAGDEILGFTAALLYSGCKTVVSSVARVDDHAAVEVMDAYHRSLARGVVAPRALADALAGEPLMPFVCFGSS